MPKCTPPARRAHLVGLALVLASGGALAACGGSGSTGPSAFTLVADAFKHAEANTWVHEIRTATEPGHTYKASDYVGQASGSQQVTFDDISVKVIVLPTAAYIEGNANAIASYFNINKTHPGKLAGKWISLKPSDRGYTSLKQPLNIGTDFASFSLLGPLTEASRMTLDGQTVLPINGFVAGSKDSEVPATLYVTTTGVKSDLPVEFSVTNSSANSTELVSWSGWGHAPMLVAPKTSIPLADAPRH